MIHHFVSSVFMKFKTRLFLSKFDRVSIEFFFIFIDKSQTILYLINSCSQDLHLTEITQFDISRAFDGVSILIFYHLILKLREDPTFEIKVIMKHILLCWAQRVSYKLIINVYMKLSVIWMPLIFPFFLLKIPF